MNNNHKKLKEATEKQHNDLESIINANRLMQFADRIHYACLLNAHFAFLSALENDDSDFTKQFQQGIRAKRELLEKDLLKLGKQLASQILPKFEIDDTNKLGWYYVIMGSQLGNRMMFKQLEKHKHFREWEAANYIGHNSEEQWKNWKDLIHQIDQLDAQSYIFVEKGATEAFFHFKNTWQETTKHLSGTHYLANS